MKNAFRTLGFIEALSFLILLCIAMPLKYMLGMPEAVRVVGMIHGVLFIMYLVAGALAARQMRWSFAKLILAYAAAVIPLGPIIFDKKLFS